MCDKICLERFSFQMKSVFTCDSKYTYGYHSKEEAYECDALHGILHQHRHRSSPFSFIFLFCWSHCVTRFAYMRLILI